MLRSTQVTLVVALVVGVSSAPHSVFKPQGHRSLQPSPELFLGGIRAEHYAEAISERQGLRGPPQHTIEELPKGSENGELPVTFTSADENTSSSLLDLPWMRSEDGTELDVKTVIRENSDNVAKKADGDSGRKLLGELQDLHETPTAAEPKTKQEIEIISEIESIISKVKEQYSKRNQPLSSPVSQDKVYSQVHTPQSIQDLLKLSTSQGIDETRQEDPVIEEARQRYMAIWNQEADRLNVPYMKVNKAWPELGMVYMPVVTQVTDQIKASESVKEAGEVFKNVWERRRTEISSPATGVEPMLKILNNFMGAWLWAETTEDNTNTSEVDEVNDQEQNLQKTNNGRFIDGTKKNRHDDSPLKTDRTKGFDSRIEELLKNIFNQKRLQPDFDPSGGSRPEEPLTKLGNKKIMLSCSVVPDVANDDIGTVSIPIADHRPIDITVANRRPNIVPSRVGSPTRDNSGVDVRPVRQQTKEQKLMTNPAPEARPAPDSAVISQVKDRFAVNVPVSDIAYLEPPVRRGVVNKSVGSTDGFAPVSRYPFSVEDVDDEHDDFQDSEEDAASQSYESDEQFSRLASHYVHRHDQY